ncbi:MAG TPA: Uma2 family endonuclease [Blastocatellia bacterium]|nr:Uma2 family endonuclease [Blastocatellia bacterium]
MPATTTDYLAAIAHLPAGASLRIDDVSWDEYEQLLADLGEGYSVRIFYDRGSMEVMAPASAHEKPKSVIHRLVTTLSDELDIESLGSTTLKAEMKAKGAEPDDSFYIQNAPLVIGRDDLDLKRDPAPDLVVEINRTSASLNKFTIYAELGVPEIWRVAGRSVHIYILDEDHYDSSIASRAFPFLSAQMISDFLARGLAEGERKAARAMREWVREHGRNAL